VLLEALTGRPAFPGAPSDAALSRLDRDPAVPSTDPAGLADLLRRMTARDPGARPSAMEAMIGFRDLILGVLNGPDPEVRDPELERIAAVREYNLIETEPDEHFDRITALAARVLRVPVALISAVDDRRVWLKSHHGLDASERDRPRALGVAGGLHEDVLVLADIHTDPRSANLPPDGRGFRFYAGVPLITEDGFNVGTFAVADYVPRSVTASELEVLKDLAAAVLHEMNLRRAARRIAIGRSRRLG
jgi:serine/threonine protein kinase